MPPPSLNRARRRRAGPPSSFRPRSYGRVPAVSAFRLQTRIAGSKARPRQRWRRAGATAKNSRSLHLANRGGNGIDSRGFGARMTLLPGPRKNVARLGRKGGKIAAINWDHVRRPGNLSHVRIIRSAAPLGRHPINVLIGVLDVTGFAMDTILRIDHVTRLSAFLDPF